MAGLQSLVYEPFLLAGADQLEIRVRGSLLWQSGGGRRRKIGTVIGQFAHLGQVFPPTALATSSASSPLAAVMSDVIRLTFLGFCLDI